MNESEFKICYCRFIVRTSTHCAQNCKILSIQNVYCSTHVVCTHIYFRTTPELIYPAVNEFSIPTSP